jgi:tRNA pseudouridine55 synthase
MMDPSDIPGSEPGGRRPSAGQPACEEPADGEMGVLNMNKPAGVTSHDVVARIRRLANLQRVGHAGTLDPMATGVLVVCLGRSTRVAEYIADAAKTYLATIHFGVVTETWDTEGQVRESHDVSGLSLAAIEQVLPAFQGCIEQVPPAYSALKRNGQPLYRLARRGVALQPAPRAVQIYQLDVVEWRSPELVLRVTCSKGTYIRSLAYDLGQRLGVGAHLSALARLAVGRFRLEDAIELDTLERDAPHLWMRHLVPLRVALAHLPGVTVDDDTARRLSFGQAVPLPEQAEGLLFAYAQDGRLVAVLEYSAQDMLWQPRKVLAPR